MQKKQLYIAYGSNINLEQMAYRCPHSKVVGTSEIKDFELEFRGVATIVPKENASVPVLIWELDEMDLTQAESKATYAEIKQYVMENAGLNVSQLYIAQVKRKHGLIERINYNVGDGKSKVPQVTPEKEKAIEEALRHFKMI